MGIVEEDEIQVVNYDDGAPNIETVAVAEFVCNLCDSMCTTETEIDFHTKAKCYYTGKFAQEGMKLALERTSAKYVAKVKASLKRKPGEPLTTKTVGKKRKIEISRIKGNKSETRKVSKDKATVAE